MTAATASEDYFTVPGIPGDPAGPQDAAAAGLLAMMFGLSEECWCAGWMHDLEYRLWDARPPVVGMGTITERQVALLHMLADEANGWWSWQGEPDPVFVLMPEWLGRFTVWQGQQAEYAARRAARETST